MCLHVCTAETDSSLNKPGYMYTVGLTKGWYFGDKDQWERVSSDPMSFPKPGNSLSLFLSCHAGITVMLIF